jgi:hypothetical protein
MKVGTASLSANVSSIEASAVASIDLDTRLIAAVQTRGGARCHRAANLLRSYYMCADVCRSRLHAGSAPAIKAACLRLQAWERRLRDFLSSSLPPGQAASG